MHEAALFADEFGDGSQEGDDVVFDFGFDFVDAGDVKIAFFAQGLCGAFGDDAEIGHFLKREGFNLQPDAEFVLLFEYIRHFGAGVAWNHMLIS